MKTNKIINKYFLGLNKEKNLKKQNLLIKIMK